MRITPVNYLANQMTKMQAVQNKPVSFGDIESGKSDILPLTRIAGEKGESLVYHDAKNLFEIENISDKKVGTKFLLHPKDPQFKDLTILFTPKSTMKSEKNDVDMIITSPLSFTGKVYGSIRKDENGEDSIMKKSYSDFWEQGMYDEVAKNYVDDEETSKIKDKYNFFVPSDGDGTRYRDIAKLQGGLTKPATQIPATLNGNNMRLVQAVLTNFAKTSKMDEGCDFVAVTPALGSAYAFFEGLASGQIPTDKPVVFSWGDNFSDIDISKLILAHEKNKAGFTMLTLPVDTQRISALGAAKVKGQNDLEMTEFFEKPKTPEKIKEFIIPETEDKCLGVVGPYVVSPAALSWLKENYIEHPENFKDEEGKVDFSRKVIGNLIGLMATGKVKDEEGNILRMMAYEKPETDTWSDLGAEKDFTAEMKNVKNGSFSNLPSEMQESISNNVDRFGNITFDTRTKHMLADFLDKYEIDLKNAVVYSK